MSGAIVVGAGPGLGLAVAARFAREGMPVAVVARRRETVEGLTSALGAHDVPVLGLTADAGDEGSLRAALDAATLRLGPPDVLVYHAGAVQRDAPGDLTWDEYQRTWRVNVLGAMTSALHVAPGMADRGSGTVLITGGRPTPNTDFVSLALGKAGVRELADILHRHLGPTGVHVATVTVEGVLMPYGETDPEVVADHYWRLHTQEPDDWETEVVVPA